ncbi:MAG TPA: R3H domain-containing nucleic acid-binding protein [Vicinamibacterales bacterium]|jgi:spoIIIJ-associated protein|nr:R3H domain-containing nucleic acid-binding protein [Vicinamibacterales bacterium]
MSTDIGESLATFLQELTAAMGLPLTAVVTESGGVYRIDLQGEGGELLLSQRGEPLKAVQHIVSTAFRRQLGEEGRVLVDCQHFRRDKDNELQQMARFLASKAVRTGAPQEIGPLNAYERRIVHLAVAEEGASSESVGDAAVKTVIISPK